MCGNQECVFALGMLLRANPGLFVIRTVSINSAIFHIVFRDRQHSTKRIEVLVGKNAGIDVIGQIGLCQTEIEMSVLVWLGAGRGDISRGASNQLRGIL